MCSDGGGWCELDGARHGVGLNRLLIIPPRLPHRHYTDAKEPWSIWWLHVTAEDVPDLEDFDRWLKSSQLRALRREKAGVQGFDRLLRSE